MSTHHKGSTQAGSDKIRTDKISADNINADKMREGHPNADLIIGLAEDMPYPVFLLERKKSEIIWANLAAQNICATSLKHLKGAAFETRLGVDWQIPEKINQACMQHGSVSWQGIWQPTARDHASLYHLNLFPVDNHIGLFIHTQGHYSANGAFGADGLSQAVRFSPALSSMGRMMAHEIKNPLTGMRGAAQLLREEVNSGDGYEFIDLIITEIDRLGRLADNMETLGEANKDEFTYFNIHKIIRQALKILKASDGHDIKIIEDYDPSLPAIYGDPDSLMQALLNLIKNAQEAIGSHGHQQGEIVIKSLFRSGVTHRHHKEDKGRTLPVEIRITDNGPGIPSDIGDQIFHPFVTDKPAGQGLGLSIVSKIIKSHDGLVEVSSRPGQTTFSLLFPISHKVEA